jgi:hypothetical protein
MVTIDISAAIAALTCASSLVIDIPSFDTATQLIGTLIKIRLSCLRGGAKARDARYLGAFQLRPLEGPLTFPISEC